MINENLSDPIEVSLQTAEKWTKAYRGNQELEDANKKVNAFLIPRESLEAVLALKTDAVRAYIGINDKKEKTLLFVGANKDEKGIYRDVFGTSQVEKDGNLGEESVVYDFSRPCPPNGDPDSPLQN
ncbi:hypothetical protein K5V07_08530 [Flavobacterium sp. CHNK8]|uniref:hypothetical protein n=1 Tax=Flavobacterium sp. CHNK8 TaxID=2871165 RepID=UPI001C8D71B4|nr:hypothetical protein [Flavobacterium sp. CHNK8]QZK90536.1 hypothetical protein K5V07_08530 [Flavobacterium sp. CHNK8]